MWKGKRRREGDRETDQQQTDTVRRRDGVLIQKVSILTHKSSNGDLPKSYLVAYADVRMHG